MPVTLQVAAATGRDEITLSDVLPANTAPLTSGSEQRFTAKVKTTLRSAASGSVVLEARDESGKPLGQSLVAAVSPGASEAGLVIPPFRLPAGVKEIRLKGVIQAGSTRTESTAVTYQVAGCAAPRALAAGLERPRAEGCDEVRIAEAQPRPDASLEPGGSPPFFAFVQYRLESEEEAELQLELKQKDILLGVSDSVKGCATQKWQFAWMPFLWQVSECPYTLSSRRPFQMPNSLPELETERQNPSSVHYPR